MQHFNGFTWHVNDTQSPVLSTTAHRIYQPSGDNSWLINFAPYSTITCQSVTSQPPDILIQVYVDNKRHFNFLLKIIKDSYIFTYLDINGD